MRTSRYSQIPAIGEDASQYTMHQLHHILEGEPRRTRGVDFIQLNNDLIFAFFFGLTDRQSQIGLLSFTAKRCAEHIRHVYGHLAMAIIDTRIRCLLRGYTSL